MWIYNFCKFLCSQNILFCKIDGRIKVFVSNVKIDLVKLNTHLLPQFCKIKYFDCTEFTEYYIHRSVQAECLIIDFI